MGRPRTFETAAAVRAARAVFWRDGYELASLPDLEAATGLSRSSIYHAFGSKRGLFDAAVSSYLDEVVRPRLRPLTAAQVGPGAMATYLTGLRAALAQPGSLPSTSGCLLINAAGAPVGRDDAVRDVIAGYRAELRSAFGRGVAAHVAAHVRAQVADGQRGQRGGPPDVAAAPGSGPVDVDDGRAHTADQEVLAETLTGLVVAALAVVRVDQPAALRLVDTAIELLGATPATPDQHATSRPTPSAPVASHRG
ncbi:hypothetical protein CELL_02183 [Cellulomonas sp. T2.31MG-18]|uniref:TetR/AcrR family transcriptional regulator n=1 Tax=Cellulomonas sp. T2.31MG-18 TaxID=3157619 RepID=UPI0035EC6A82